MSEAPNGHSFAKVLSIVPLHSRCTRALNVENFCQQALANCRSDPTSIKLVSVQRCAYDGVE